MLVFAFNRDLVAELPFILMHPKPEEEEPNPILTDRSPGKHSNQRSDDANENASSQVTTGNLIQLDGSVLCSMSYLFIYLHTFTYQQQICQIPMISTANVFFFMHTHSDDDFKDDDIIFEDFARLRLKGGETEA